MSVQNQPWRMGYLGVTVAATTVATPLQKLIETLLGLTAGSMATVYREIQIQVDPETNAGSSLRIGVGNLGTTVGGLVQKGITLAGGADTYRSTYNNLPMGSLYVQGVGGTVNINVQLFSM